MTHIRGDDLDGPIRFAGLNEDKSFRHYAPDTMVIYEGYDGWHINITSKIGPNGRYWLDPTPSNLPINWFIA